MVLYNGGMCYPERHGSVMLALYKGQQSLRVSIFTSGAVLDAPKSMT